MTMRDPCQTCPHNQGIGLGLGLLEPRAPEWNCGDLIARAIIGRAKALQDKADSGAGREPKHDPSSVNEAVMHALDRELEPFIVKAIDRYFASKDGHATKTIKPADPLHAAAVMLHVGTSDAKAFYCEKRHQCKWQGLRMHQGLGWGKIPDDTDPWLVWHKRECGGRLIELFLKPELEEQKEGGRAQ